VCRSDGRFCAAWRNTAATSSNPSRRNKPAHSCRSSRGEAAASTSWRTASMPSRLFATVSTSGTLSHSKNGPTSRRRSAIHASSAVINMLDQVRSGLAQDPSGLISISVEHSDCKPKRFKFGLRRCQVEAEANIQVNLSRHKRGGNFQIGDRIGFSNFFNYLGAMLLPIRKQIFEKLRRKFVARPARPARRIARFARAPRPQIRRVFRLCIITEWCVIHVMDLPLHAKEQQPKR
jgi:hypothetical protein